MTITYTYIFIAFIISLTLSLVGTPLVVKLCHDYKLFDIPNARKVHQHNIPRLGGILFMPSSGLGFIITLTAIYLCTGEHHLICVSNLLMIVGAFMIYVIGIIDDLYGMKATHKFIVQCIAALLLPLCNLMISNLHGLFGVYDMPLWVSYFLTIFTILLIINAINLIDGIDGLASGLAFLILSAFTYLYYTLGAHLFCLISAGLAGSTLAFFFFNVYGEVGKQKTFMGDSGSLFLGYAIAYLAIKYQMSDNQSAFVYREESLLVSFSLVFLPCADVIRVAFQRALRRQDIFEADKTHIHHCIMKTGLNMHWTLIVIIALFVSICLLNYGLYASGLHSTFIMASDILIYIIFIEIINVLKKSDKT